MTTSYNQRTMHQRKLPTGNVVRCLFPKSENDEGQIDNYRNRDREIFEREREENKKKWNYDFDNDCPLTGEGNVKWLNQNDKGEWIGLIQNGDETDEVENKAEESEPRDEEDKTEDVRMQNEVTPDATPVKSAIPPPVRKRSRDGTDNPADSTKRKIL